MCIFRIFYYVGNVGKFCRLLKEVMKMNNKIIMIQMLSILVAFVGIGALISDWGIRKEMIYYKNWKEIYDSRYCPTCGHILESEEIEND
jgi:hypothetical protein